jgi:hypothetical protein
MVIGIEEAIAGAEIIIMLATGNHIKINKIKIKMELLTEIQVRRTNHSKLAEVDFSNLEFGKFISDHMLVCDYANG